MGIRILLLVFLFLASEVQCKVPPGKLSLLELSGIHEISPAFSANLPGVTGRQFALADSVTGSIHFRNAQSKFITKALRGSLFIFGFESGSTLLLIISPESISKWDRSTFSVENCLNNLKRAYNEPPVIDNDSWVINYIGHPYQGGYFYNAVRSQNASILQSSLFCFGHSMLWEYFTEAFYEQPSAQDLVVTPIAGVVLGELAHRATIRMSRNGFTAFEKALTILINPMFVLNNGFKHKTVKPKTVDW
jgi:hypothetical protein